MVAILKRGRADCPLHGFSTLLCSFDSALCELPVYEFRLFPRAKLTMFLHQQYMDAGAQNRLVRNRILTFARLSRIASSIKNHLHESWMQLAETTTSDPENPFSALSGLRYFCEIPLWLWLNRAGRASVQVLEPK
jgi:hypothetical protein